MTEPTNDEIDALVAAYLGDCGPQATRVYSFARAALAPADSVTAPATESYVQPVPDKCDRIVWRGHYYHLPCTRP